MEKIDYIENGYCIYKNYIDKNKIKTYNNEIDRLQNILPIDNKNDIFDESNTGKIKQIQYLYLKSEIFKELLYDMSKIATNIFGNNDYIVLNMQLFEKHPYISKPTRPHQDNAYIKITPPNALTIWISLDDIDENNGCMYYMPKSHLTPTHKHNRYHSQTTFRIRSGVPGLSLCLHEHPEEKDIPVPTKEGDIIVHNCNTIHRSGKNNSNNRRRAIGIIYMPTYCTKDDILMKYHYDNLKEDIELQKIKDPILYKHLKSKY